MILTPLSSKDPTYRRNLLKSVQKALNRKTISTNYHTNMPVFLRSEGPFAMYDHSLRNLNLD